MDMMRFAPGREAEWDSERCAEKDDSLLLDLTPHKTHSVLLGDRYQHRFDRILFSQLKTLEDAERANELHGTFAADGSLVYTGTAVDFPATISETSNTDLVDTVPPTGLGRPSPCPFVNDPETNHRNWEALHDLPSNPNEELVAMNVLTVPDPDLYKEYASHFAHLPSKYGFRVLECSKLPLDSGKEGSYTMLVAVAFPNARTFASCWSDRVIKKRAYPLRKALFAGGFRHVWLRCTRI